MIVENTGTYQIDPTLNESNNFFRIQIRQKNEVNDDVFQAIILDEEKIYSIGVQDKIFTDFKNCGFYDLDTLSHEQLEILRFDKENDIISGTFEFTAINPDCTDTIRVTEGRFDVQY